MRYIWVGFFMTLTACSSSPRPHSSALPPAASQQEELSPEAMSEVVAAQQTGDISGSSAAGQAIKMEDLRSEVAKSYAGLRTREGKSLSSKEQELATQHTLGLVDASQRRDYLAMSSSAQSLVQLLQTVSPPKAALVDGLGLAKAIQDVVAASLQANVQDILKAVAAIVAAAMA